MNFREAVSKDIDPMHRIRIAVKENVLSNPLLITPADYEEFINRRGKGWVCEVEGEVIGFAICDLEENNIWALFVDPRFEGQGIGKKLHDIMLEWYFNQGKDTVWLSTSPGTRAESFYRKAGWVKKGVYGKGEILFEFDRKVWKRKGFF